MQILILGAAGPYPERLSVFKENGHEIWYVSTEPLPIDLLSSTYMIARNFTNLGTTTDEAINAIISLIMTERIDVVYSLLNVWDGSNDATAALLNQGCPVPVIRHYKEHYLSPSEAERKCIEKSSGVIFINEEALSYFTSQYQLPTHVACIDADLIPRRYLTGNFQPKLSATDGSPHLLIAGSVSADGGRYDYRDLIDSLTQAGAHVHLYAQFRTLTSSGQLNNTEDVKTAYQQIGRQGFVHIHSPIPPERFVEEWSRYDAGLLHVPRSDDPFRFSNMPNRYSAYLAAGLPVALANGEMPAMQRKLKELGAIISYNGINELMEQLPDPNWHDKIKVVRNEVSFEAVFQKLIAFIRQCVYS